MKYNAFISYSHAADGKLAPALQKALQQLAKPWYQLKALNVFRDATSLSATPNLWNTIEEALGESRYLILMASPESARSIWVQREIDFWLSNKSLDTLLIALTDGQIVWDDKQGNDFDWTATNALPANLQGVFTQEPLYVDLRGARTAKDLSLSNPEFKQKAVILAATLHGKSVGDLVGEEVEQHRKTIRLRNAAITVLSILLLISSLTTWWATNQTAVANERTLFAEQQQQIAEISTRSAQTQRVLAQRNAQMASDSAAYARTQERIAKRQQGIAELQRNLALAAQRETELQKIIAETQRDSARYERDVAEANRLAAQALNISEQDPNFALRLAEVAYGMHDPPLPNVSQTLATISYNYFDQRIIPYAQAFDLAASEVEEAWLLADDQGVVFNSGLRGGTYYLNTETGAVRKLRELSSKVLLAPARDFFLTNYSRLGHPDCQEEPILLWSKKGELVAELQVRGEAIRHATSLSACNKIIAETADGGIALFNPKGELETVLTDQGKPLSLRGSLEDYSWQTAAGDFFTFNEGGSQMWSCDGKLVKRFANGVLKQLSADHETVVLEQSGQLELVDLNNFRRTVLERSYEFCQSRDFVKITYSSGGQYIIGQKAALMDNDKSAKIVVWNGKGKIVREINLQYAHIQKIETSPNDQHLMVVTANSHNWISDNGEQYSPWDNDYLKIWRTEDGKLPIKQMKIVNNNYATPKPSFLDDSKIVYLTEENTLSIFNFLSSQIESNLQSDSEIIDYKIAEQGRTIVANAQDDTKVWSANGQLELTIPAVEGAAFATKWYGDQVLSYSPFGSDLRIWNAEQDLFFEYAHGESIREVHFSDDEQKILLVSYHGVSLWNRNGQLEKRIFPKMIGAERREEGNFHARFYPNSHAFVTWSYDELAIWDENARKLVSKPLAVDESKFYNIENIHLFPQMNRMLAYDVSGNTSYWILDKLQMDAFYPAMGTSLPYLEFSSQDQVLVNARATKQEADRLVLWDCKPTMLDSVQLQASVSTDNRLSLSKDETRILTPYRYGSAALWSVAGAKLAAYAGHDGRVEGVSFSPAEDQVLSYAGTEVFVWDIEGGPPTLEIDISPVGLVRDALFTPDGNFIIITTYSCAYPLLVYSADGSLVAADNSHVDMIDQIVFSPSGQYFLTATGGREDNYLKPNCAELSDVTAKLWTLDGKLLADFNKHTQQVTSVGFLEQGDYVYTASADGTLKIFPIPASIFDWLQHDSPISPLTAAQKERYRIR